MRARSATLPTPGSAIRRGLVQPVLAARLWPLFVLASLLGRGAVAAEIQATESDIKAAFTFNFIKYVTWPDDDDIEEFRVGVVGAEELLEPLRKISSSRQAKGKPIRIIEVADIDDLDRCHVLFVGERDPRSLEELLASIGGKAILTIADTPGYAAKGVGLNFYEDGSHVRFEANLESLEGAQLRCSAQLLQLARIVRAEQGSQP